MTTIVFAVAIAAVSPGQITVNVPANQLGWVGTVNGTTVYYAEPGSNDFVGRTTSNVDRDITLDRVQLYFWDTSKREQVQFEAQVIPGSRRVAQRAYIQPAQSVGNYCMVPVQPNAAPQCPPTHTCARVSFAPTTTCYAPTTTYYTAPTTTYYAPTVTVAPATTYYAPVQAYYAAPQPVCGW